MARRSLKNLALAYLAQAGDAEGAGPGPRASSPRPTT